MYSTACNFGWFQFVPRRFLHQKKAMKKFLDNFHRKGNWPWGKTTSIEHAIWKWKKHHDWSRSFSDSKVSIIILSSIHYHRIIYHLGYSGGLSFYITYVIVSYSHTWDLNDIIVTHCRWFRSFGNRGSLRGSTGMTKWMRGQLALEVRILEMKAWNSNV